MRAKLWMLTVAAMAGAAVGLYACSGGGSGAPQPVVTVQSQPEAKGEGAAADAFLGDAARNAKRLLVEGRKIFRFDTFGDEAFWTDQLQLQTSVATLSPRAALGLGLKVRTCSQSSSYDERFGLQLTPQEKSDLVEYLKSL